MCGTESETLILHFLAFPVYYGVRLVFCIQEFKIYGLVIR